MDGDLIDPLGLSVRRGDGDLKHRVAAAGTQVFAVHTANRSRHRLRGKGDSSYLIGDRHRVGKHIRVKFRLQRTVIRPERQKPGIAAGRRQHLEGQGNLHIRQDKRWLWAGNLKDRNRKGLGTGQSLLLHLETVSNNGFRSQEWSCSRSGVHGGNLSRPVHRGSGACFYALPIGGPLIGKSLPIIGHRRLERRHISQRPVVGNGNLHHGPRAALLHREGRGKTSGLSGGSPKNSQDCPAQQTERKSPPLHGLPLFSG